MGISLIGKNLIPGEGDANSFLNEEFLIVWKLKFITLSNLPSMLLFLLRTCVTCVMSATPISDVCKVLGYLKMLIRDKSCHP